MNLQWILLAFFLAAIVREVFNAMTRPMHKNVLNLISIPVAFIITLIIQKFGVFQMLAGTIMDSVLGAVNSMLGTHILEEAGTPRELVVALLSTFLAPVLFITVYSAILFLLKLIHVNLLSKYIEHRQFVKEKRLFKIALREEKTLVKKIVREAEEQTLDILDEVTRNDWDHDVLDDYDVLNGRQLDKLIDKRIAKEKRARKRRGFFKESKEKRSVSIIVSAISGFLAFAIALMPVFYTMSALSDITYGIDPDDDENTHPVYLAVDFLDKHILGPYEDTFVYQIYDSMGLVDLMTNVVSIGGNVEINGTTVQADHLVRDVFVSVVQAFTQMTSPHPNEAVLRKALSEILVENSVISPMIIDAIHSAIADLTLDDVDIPLVGDMLTKLIEGYQQDKQMIAHDINALVDLVVIMTKQQMVAKIISGNADFESILANKDDLKELVGAMAGLSLFGVLMETAFMTGIDMITSPDFEFMSLPLNSEEGYNRFVQKIVDTAGSLTSSSAMKVEDFPNLKSLFENAATYEKSANNNASGLLAYLVDPLYRAELLKPELEEVKTLYDEYLEIYNELERLEAIEHPTEDDLKEIERLLEEQKKLIGDQDFDVVMEETEAKFNDITERFNQFAEDSKLRFGYFGPFINYFLNWNSIHKPFMLSGADKTSAPISITVNGEIYVCNTDTISLEKILDCITGGLGDLGDLSGIIPDFSDAESALNTKVDDIIANIPMKDLLEALTFTKKTESDEIVVSPVADLVNFLIEKYAVAADDTLTVETFKSVVLPEFISANADDSAYSEKLAQEIIDGTFKFEGVTVEKLKASLRFGDDWTDELKNQDAANLVDVIFTLVDMIGSLSDSNPDDSEQPDAGDVPTGDGQTDTDDSTEQEPVVDPLNSDDTDTDNTNSENTDSGDTGSGDVGTGDTGSGDTGSGDVGTGDTGSGDSDEPVLPEGDGSGETGELDAIFGLFTALGDVFDVMNKTYSLKHLPRVMIEAILTNDMLSMAMTPSMLHDYMEQLDDIENGEGTYATFMTEFVETVQNLLDKFNTSGGETE